MTAEDDGAPDAEQRHERGDGERVQKEVAGVLDAPPRQEGTVLGRPEPLTDDRGQDQRDKTGGHELAQPAASVAPRPWVRSKVPSASKISNPVAAATPSVPADHTARRRVVGRAEAMSPVIVVMSCPLASLRAPGRRLPGRPSISHREVPGPWGYGRKPETDSPLCRRDYF